jgi:hypothetical protein
VPIVFNCPACAKQLQVSDAAAGRSSKCPYCKGPITVPQASQAVMAASRVPAPPAAITPSAPPPVPMRPAAPPPLPSAGVTSPPRFMQFVQRSNGFLKKFGPWGYVAAGVAGLLVFSLFVVAAVRLFGSSSGIDHASRYFPAKTNFIVAINSDDILGSQIYQDLKKEVPDLGKMEKEMGQKGEIGMKDVSQAFFAGNIDAVDKEGVVFATLLKRKMDVTFLNTRKGAEAGGVTIYEAPDHCSCQVDRTTIVECNGPPSTLQSILTNKSPGLTPAMKAACKDVDFTRSIAAVVTFQDVNKQGAVGKMIQEQPALEALETVVAHVTFGSSDISVEAVATCKDADKAKDIQKLLDGLIAGVKLSGKATPKDVKDLLGNLKIEQTGNKVKLSVKVTKAQAVALFNSGLIQSAP